MTGACQSGCVPIARHGKQIAEKRKPEAKDSSPRGKPLSGRSDDMTPTQSVNLEMAPRVDGSPGLPVPRDGFFPMRDDEADLQRDHDRIERLTDSWSSRANVRKVGPDSHARLRSEANPISSPNCCRFTITRSIRRPRKNSSKPSCRAVGSPTTKRRWPSNRRSSRRRACT